MDACSAQYMPVTIMQDVVAEGVIMVVIMGCYNGILQWGPGIEQTSIAMAQSMGVHVVVDSGYVFLATIQLNFGHHTTNGPTMPPQPKGVHCHCV